MTQPAQPTQAIQNTSPDRLIGSFADPKAANARLACLMKETNLITPATSVGNLPEGCEIAITLIRVNADLSAKEVYPTGSGQFGLAKVVLDKIASAAGISWDVTQCGRTDSGRDPRRCAYKAVGTLAAFDGSERTIFGEVDLDVNDGSDQVDALYARAKGDGGDKQLRDLRLFLTRHAQTKAMLRAVRSIGIKTGYSEEELKKPFGIARLMFTGRTENPALAAFAFQARAMASIGGKQALFGGQQLGQGQSQGTRPMMMLPDIEVIDVPQPQPSPAPARQAAPARAAAPPPAVGTDGRQLSGLLSPWTKTKGTPMEQLEDADLTFWLGKAKEDLQNPEKAKFHKSAQKAVGLIEAELAYRANPPKAPAQQPPPDQGGPDDGPPPGLFDDADQY